MIILFLLCLIGFLLRYKNLCWRSFYISYLIVMYRDFTLGILGVILALHFVLNIDSIIILFFPLLSIIGVYAFESVFIHYSLLITKVSSPLQLNTIKDGILYVETILKNAELVGNEIEYSSERILHDEKANAANCLLYGMLSAHRKVCEDQDCICHEAACSDEDDQKKLNRRDTEKEKLFSTTKWKKFAKHQLAELLNKYQSDASLHIMAACLEYWDMKNKYKALYNISRAEDQKPTIMEKIDILYIKLQIQEEMLKQKSEINMESSMKDGTMQLILM